MLFIVQWTSVIHLVYLFLKCMFTSKDFKMPQLPTHTVWNLLALKVLLLLVLSWKTTSRQPSKAALHPDSIAALQAESPAIWAAPGTKLQRGGRKGASFTHFCSWLLQLFLCAWAAGSITTQDCFIGSLFRGVTILFSFILKDAQISSGRRP